MANVAILIGNSRYDSLRPLPCCKADLHAMRELLDATEKYSGTYIVEDFDADTLKTKVREAIQDNISTEELFVYFTGHGFLPIRLSPTPTICSVSPWTAGKGRRRRIEEAIRLILDCSENRTGGYFTSRT